MAFTRLCTLAQVKEHIENIDTADITDAEIESFIDSIGEDIRDGFGYPYVQVVTNTSTDQTIYFLGSDGLDMFDIERAFYDQAEITEDTDFTVNLEKGTFTFDASFTVETKELRIWLIPRRFSELASIQTALFIMRLSEGFQRGEPSKNLTILDFKLKLAMRHMDNFIEVEVDSLGQTVENLNPYKINEIFVTQDHDKNAYL